MKRIAAPMVGGMISSALLTVIVIPAVCSLWREWEAGRAAQRTPITTREQLLVTIPLSQETT